MKVRRKIIVSLLMMILLIALAGCGTKTDTQEHETVKTDEESGKNEITAEEFIAKMIVAADGAVVTKSDCNVEFDVTVNRNNTIHTMNETLVTHNEYDTENGWASSKINRLSEAGETIGKATYNLAEESGVLYYYAEQGGGWIKYEACFDKGEISRNFVSSMNLGNADILSFETEGEQYNGQPVYKLSVVLKDADIRELVFESGLKWLLWAEEYASVDLKDIKLTMDYYVDPESAQVLKAEARLEGMTNFIKAIFAGYYDSDLEEQFQEEHLNKCILVYDNISYEDYTLPKMSFEEKKNSVLIHQKDTTYTISMLNAEVDIICPKGWCVYCKEQDYINLYRADGAIDIWYSLNHGVSPQEYLADRIPYNVEDEKSWGEYVSDQIGPQMDGYETYEILLKDGIRSIAYTTVEESLLVIDVTDYTSNRMDRSLPEVLDRVSWEE